MQDAEDQHKRRKDYSGKDPMTQHGRFPQWVVCIVKQHKQQGTEPKPADHLYDKECSSFDTNVDNHLNGLGIYEQ